MLVKILWNQNTAIFSRTSLWMNPLWAYLPVRATGSSTTFWKSTLGELKKYSKSSGEVRNVRRLPATCSVKIGPSCKQKKYIYNFTVCDSVRSGSWTDFLHWGPNEFQARGFRIIKSFVKSPEKKLYTWPVIFYAIIMTNLLIKGKNTFCIWNTFTPGLPAVSTCTNEFILVNLNEDMPTYFNRKKKN